MDTQTIDERDFQGRFRENNHEHFQKFVSDYDNFMTPQLRAQG
jgi:hypothetical protein